MSTSARELTVQIEGSEADAKNENIKRKKTDRKIFMNFTASGENELF